MKLNRTFLLTAGVLTTWLVAPCVRGDALFTEIHGFVQYDNVNGFSPQAGLVQGNDGYLYGTTSQSLRGTVFRVSTNGVFSTLVRFVNLNYPYDGFDPLTALVQGSDGNFYGTTSSGGQFMAGTIFQMTPAGVLSTFYAFTGGSDGGPASRLVQGKDGNFYGTTRGGTYRNGTIFRITPQGAFATLYSFTGGIDGAVPNALVQGTDGNFYGTTVSGGAQNYGTVFTITPQGSLTTLHSFAGDNDGATPIGGLVQGADGGFYGTTYYRGAYTYLDSSGYGYGTVFKVTTNGILTTLVSFNNTNGANPDSTLVKGVDGNFYGATYGGLTDYGIFTGLVPNFGTVFQVTPSGMITTLASFDYMNGYGADPNDLLQGTDGNLYGTAQNGGTAFGASGGIVFRINLAARPTITTENLLPTGAVGVAYSQTLAASGGTTPYAWAVASGSLPAGLSLSSGGVISGTPIAATTNNFRVRVTAANSLFAEGDFILPVNPPSGGPLNIVKLQANVNFAKLLADGCTVKGTFSLPANYSYASRLVTLDVGGAEVSFTLGSKGSGHNGTSTFSKPTYNKKTSLWTFNATLKNGYWRTLWAEYGMTNSTILKPGVLVTNFPVILVVDTEAFMGTTNLHYTAKWNKSGTAK